MVIALCARKALLARSSFLRIPKRNGYFVLVPEVGDDSQERDPLLGQDKLPAFKQITAEKCVGAIARQTVEFEESIKSISKRLEDYSDVDIFKYIFLPMEEAYAPLEVTFGITQLLYIGCQNRMPQKYYENICDRAQLALATRFINDPIFEACKKASKNKELNDHQKSLLKKFVREGKLNALELDPKKRSKLGYYHSFMLQKSMEYSQKLQIQTKKFAYTIRNPELLRDFPEEFLQKTAVNPEDYRTGPWRLSLDPYVIREVLEKCPDRHLRFILWEADVIKASLLDDRMYQVSSALEEIREKRQMKAQLLGYKSFAEMSIETKMAESLEKVTTTLEQMRIPARSAQEEELQELNDFAKEHGFSDSLKMWDVSYWRRLHLQTKLNYNPETVKEYFPLPTVLFGLFNFMETMFSVKFVERQMAGAWHKDVRFYDVYDLKESSTEPVANFYFDPYVRLVDKGRWTDRSGCLINIRNRSKICGVKPLSAMIFNFPQPKDDKPSLLSFNDVYALFQKFGHLVQNCLCKGEYSEISGFSAVEWDAAHISDFFMSNWLWEPSVLKQVSGHWSTNEPLPAEIIDSMQRMRTHFAGFDLCKQLYYSQLDLELHTSDDFWEDIMRRMWDDYFAIPLYKKDAHVCSFAQIFTGSHAAAYYSPLWSSMIAADLFSAYAEQPERELQQQKQIGQKYRETFLCLSGVQPTNELFRRFRGRDPSEQALLRNLGLHKNTLSDPK